MTPCIAILSAFEMARTHANAPEFATPTRLGIAAEPASYQNR